MKPRKPVNRRLPSSVVGALISSGLLIVPQNAVDADTLSVGAEVTFVERIEVAPAPLPKSAGAATVSDETATSREESRGAVHESFVTVLSIRAIPRRAVTLRVGVPGTLQAARFFCSYGGFRRAPCGAAGLAAVSVASAELTVDLGSEGSAEPARGSKEPTDIEVTITYQ